ncbi:MAG: hypothetical protein U1F50_08190 [Rubrivivax sp.]
MATNTLGSILVQPQMLSRMQGRDAAEELADEFVSLLHKIALDPAAFESLLPTLQAAGDALGQRLAARVQAKLPQGLAALQALFDPLVARFVALGSGSAEAVDVLGRIADALDAAAGAADALSDDAIRAFVRRLASIATQDFGLSLDTLKAELRTFFTQWRDALESTQDAGEAPTRHALGCLLARLERLLASQVPEVDLGADRLAGLLIAELRRTGIADVRDKAACLLGKLQAVLRALADVARLMAASGGGLPRELAAPQARALPAAKARKAAVKKTRKAAARPALRATARAAGVTPGAPAPDLSWQVPPRSEDAHYLWYASWLYATRLQGFCTDTPGGTALLQTIIPGYPTDEVWASSDYRWITLRRAAGADELLSFSESPRQWHEAAQFSGNTPVSPVQGSAHAEHFVFPRFSAEFLETWAKVTAVLADAAAGMWHMVMLGASPKEFACNIPLWLWKWTQFAAVAVSETPLPSLIAQKAGWGMGGKYPFSPLVSMLMVIFGSLEGVHTKAPFGNCFLQWLTLLGADALNAFTIHTVTQAVRSVSLSLFTLINYQGPGSAPSGTDTRPKNWDMAGPVFGLVNTLVGMLFFKIIPREHYGLPIGGNPTPFLLWYFVGFPIANFVGTMAGVATGWAIARTVTPSRLWIDPLIASGVGLVSFIVQMYVSMEGDTDDGRYNANEKPDGSDFATPRLPFDGYPPIGSSPYRLPLAAGGKTFVGQANQGLFSHMRYGSTVQVYAYDFAHDYGDEVLCVRDGTVVDWFDFYPDNENLSFDDAGDLAKMTQAAADAQAAGLITAGQSGFNGNLTGNWNFVLIRHDTQVAEHDKDQGGTLVFTFAEYGHGKNGGVRAAFAARGVAPNAIIGTKVQRGHVVMLSDDTGVSFHNHLHLHVRAAVAGTTPAAPPITPDKLSPYTLPFVFQEGIHLFGRDGPLRHLTWYESQNVRLG